MASIMIYGTTSSAGKSFIVTGLCRIFSNMNMKVSPFKSQNMSRFYHELEDGKLLSIAQYTQVLGARTKLDPRLNPLLLVPKTNTGSSVYYLGEKIKDMEAKEYFQYKKDFKEKISSIYEQLAKDNDIVVIEGAGSPAEINLMEKDIVNTGMAEIADTNCLLVVDIDRGGAFAHLYGTVMLLPEKDRKRIKGFIINKFRGDISFLDSGIKTIEEKTGIPVLGVVPYGKYKLPEEDSLSTSSDQSPMKTEEIDKEIEKLAKDLEKYLNMEEIFKIAKLS